MQNHDSITLCCLLWARDGAAGALSDYEDAVLEFLAPHGGELLTRVVSEGTDGVPDEVQTYRFPSAAALDGYLHDPARLALADWRDRVVARTELFPVETR
ncbi:hypothetical protein GCM10025867_07480 [Frondihabitans sucicola]|uniref:DUF1330 domain-containing protein n=1 Tax=Frondihabitans sucicola TaxID=1268041 RepID=A0ABM8GJD5_9MICO|nr:hypothetical protein [Frondihabitans sucicola]BDZ48507.1 hypothetical protein GCM10025867_07480 [Frondihabitans sucicola]